MSYGYPEHDPSCTCHLCVPPPPWEPPPVIDPNQRPANYAEPAAETPEDVINPAYYRAANGMQPNHVVDAFGLDYNAGTALVYLIRAGRKGDRLTDLRKCRHYIDRCIAAEEAAR